MPLTANVTSSAQNAASPNLYKTTPNYGETPLNLTQKRYSHARFRPSTLIWIFLRGLLRMLISRPVPTTRPRRLGRKRRLAALTTLGLAGLIVGLLAGCGTGNSPEINSKSSAASATSFVAASGNWKFTPGSSTHIAFAGAITVSGNTVSGTLHPTTALCAASTDPFKVAGTVSASGLFTITSSNFATGTLTISGALAPDQHSLIDPTITISGSSCATAATPSVHSVAHVDTAPTAQQYEPLTGNYNGIFTDTSGATLTVAASLSQPTTPDANGVYHLTGYATFPNTSCLNTPVITDSTITGDSIQATYTDQATGNTVVGNGTFSSDAQTLTITNWILSGCGDDTGTGLLTRHTN